MSNDMRWAVGFLVSFFVLFFYIMLGFFYFDFDLLAHESESIYQTIWYGAIILFCFLGPIYIPYSIVVIIKMMK